LEKNKYILNKINFTHSTREIFMLKNKSLITALSLVVMSFSLISCAHVQSDAHQTGQYVSGSAVTADVKAKLLGTKHLKSTDISVTTVDSTVTLTGSVPTMKQKHRAYEVAKHVNGVSAVKNELVVKQ
jgi:osmotically-inducible protein OsmY